MMALSGVRSSWLMLATNCDLCSLASASWRLLSWISSNSRTFSIAIAAWSAKVVTSSICLSVNGSTVLRVKISTPVGVPSRSIGTPRTVRTLANPDPVSHSDGNISIGCHRDRIRIRLPERRRVRRIAMQRDGNVAALTVGDIAVWRVIDDGPQIPNVNVGRRGQSRRISQHRAVHALRFEGPPYDLVHAAADAMELKRLREGKGDVPQARPNVGIHQSCNQMIRLGARQHIVGAVYLDTPHDQINRVMRRGLARIGIARIGVRIAADA